MYPDTLSAVTIIGKGALGTSIADFFKKNNILVYSEWNSKEGRVLTDSGHTRKVFSHIPVNNQQTASLVCITVPDDLIKTISDQLVNTEIEWPGKTVIHCSGNLSSDEMSSLAAAGARIASMHPIQTFKAGDGAERFMGITVSLEGDKKATDELEKLIALMNAKPIHLTKEQKRAMHIAAVFASNYMSALMHTAAEYLAKEGMEEGINILKPLILQTVQNIVNNGAVDSLTGPVARGDIASIRKHLDSLKTNDKMFRIYQILGKEAVEIAKLRGELSNDVIREMLEVLSE